MGLRVPHIWSDYFARVECICSTCVSVWCCVLVFVGHSVESHARTVWNRMRAHATYCCPMCVKRLHVFTHCSTPIDTPRTFEHMHDLHHHVRTRLEPQPTLAVHWPHITNPDCPHSNMHDSRMAYFDFSFFIPRHLLGSCFS